MCLNSATRAGTALLSQEKGERCRKQSPLDEHRGVGILEIYAR